MPDTGGNGCEIDAAGDIGTTTDPPIGVDMGCPAGTAADSPKCQPGNESDYGIAASKKLDHFWTRSDFNNQDFALGATNALYEMNGTPVRDKNNRVEWALLGRTRRSDKAAEFWGLADTKARCASIKRLMPIEKVTE